MHNADNAYEQDAVVQEEPSLRKEKQRKAVHHFVLRGE